jgi:AcrR family transcriptional regulator
MADSARKPRRTHTERREEAEARMIDAAVRIVAERGLEELTLAECGEAAGYSRGLAAHYFGSKEHLLPVIAAHIVADYSQRLRAGSRRLPGLDGLLESVAFYIDSGRDNVVVLRAFHAVLGSALKRAPLSAEIAALNHNSIAAFADPIRRGIERGEIRRDVDPMAQAAMIVAALRGVMTQWLLDPARTDLERIKADYLASLRRGLAA